MQDNFMSLFTPEPNTGCWLWEGHITKGGYGKYKGKLAHRESFTRFKSSPGNLFVLHKCDNPCCINPDHLFLGTQIDNMQDMISKGRQAILHGELNGRAILTEEAVLAIRNDSRSNKEIAIHYNIGKTTVWNIKHKLRWAHL